jgi:hypothetical protein
MGMDQAVDRLPRHGAGANLISQRRKADLDPFLCKSLGLSLRVRQPRNWQPGILLGRQLERMGSKA